LIALGSSLPFGDLRGEALLDAALMRLAALGYALLGCSSAWTTIAWPDPADPPFTNAAAALAAGARAPHAILADLHAVERWFGRVRGVLNAPRTLDLDLLDLDGAMLESPTLVLPHQRMHTRGFVMGPVAEFWPDWRHPRLGVSAAELAARLQGAEAR
jgi:2-amino-4-hydroxy-6-hydroxymethyldihydropteridine diphosphokinase